MTRSDSVNRDPSEVAEGKEHIAQGTAVSADEAGDLFGAPAADGASKKERGMFAQFVSIASFILVIASLGAAYYFYGQAKTLRENPQKIAQDEVAMVVAQVGRLIMIPEGEAPTVATVSDAERLKDQPFFAAARNGDKVLIYTNARKAILYRPDQNKLIEVAPLNLGTP